MNFKKDKDFVCRLENIELGKKYKNRKEVLECMGYDGKKTKGSTGKKMQRMIDDCTEYEKSGRSYVFTDITDNISKVNNTLKSIQGYRILNLLTEHYLKNKEIWNYEGTVVKISINNLLLDMGLCSDRFVKYKNIPSQLLRSESQLDIDEAKTVYDFINLTNAKLRANLFAALDFLDKQMVLKYKSGELYMDYTVTTRIYKDKWDNLPDEILKDLGFDYLEEGIEDFEEATYNSKRLNTNLDGALDNDSDYDSVEEIYDMCERRLLKKYVQRYNLEEKYKNTEDLRNRMKYIIFNKIDKNKGDSALMYYQELNKMFSEELTRIYQLHNYRIDRIEVHNVKKMLRIGYNKDVIEEMLDFNFEVTRKEINDKIVEQVKELAKDRNEDYLQQLEDATRKELTKLQEDFKYVRTNENYTRDCESLSDLLLKIREREMDKLNGFNIDKSD